MTLSKAIGACKKGFLKAPFLFFMGFLVSLFLVFLSGCAGARPLINQSKAHVAKDYARENGALRHASKSYERGLFFLEKADEFFSQRRYNEAKKYYVYAMRYFEKAEVKSRVLNVKNGVEL